MWDWSNTRVTIVKLFSRRIAELETKNRILTDATQRRTERIEELERELEQIEGLKSERAFLSGRIAQLEEHNRQLSEAATKYASWAQDYPRVEAEHAFYSKRVVELEEHNRQLTEAATKYASRIQELEREFEKIATLIKPNPSM
jgi:chromosome segregation ATPase